MLSKLVPANMLPVMIVDFLMMELHSLTQVRLPSKRSGKFIRQMPVKKERTLLQVLIASLSRMSKRICGSQSMHLIRKPWEIVLAQESFSMDSLILRSPVTGKEPVYGRSSTAGETPSLGPLLNQLQKSQRLRLIGSELPQQARKSQESSKPRSLIPKAKRLALKNPMRFLPPLPQKLRFQSSEVLNFRPPSQEPWVNLFPNLRALLWNKAMKKQLRPNVKTKRARELKSSSGNKLSSVRIWDQSRC